MSDKKESVEDLTKRMQVLYDESFQKELEATVRRSANSAASDWSTRTFLNTAAHDAVRDKIKQILTEIDIPGLRARVEEEVRKVEIRRVRKYLKLLEKQSENADSE